MYISWGDVATWVTGIATIALFIIGFCQIRNERKARERADDEKRVSARCSQADQIAVWIAMQGYNIEYGSELWIAVRNQSSQPIYNLVIQCILLGNDGDVFSRRPFPEHQARIDVVPPGEGYIPIRFEPGGMFKRPGVELAFQDAKGINWLRGSKGELTEIDVPPVQYYGVDLPTGWESLYASLPKDE